MFFFPDNTLLNGVLFKKPNLYKVCASSYLEGHEPQQALNTEDSYFHSKYGFCINNIPKNEKSTCDDMFWYQIEFNDYFILESYTIMSRYQYPIHPINWKMYGSIDNSTWVLLHQNSVPVWKEDEHNKAVNFKTDKRAIFKYFRLEQPNSKDNDNNRLLSFGAIDFFGTYLKFETCIHKYSYDRRLLFSIFTAVAIFIN